MGKFAESTTVSPERSRAEIETVINRYGADAFGYGIEAGRAMVQFRCKGKYVRFVLVMPDPKEKRFWTIRLNQSSRIGTRTPQQAAVAHDQEIRQKWRALYLVVKAKLEAVESGITTFEQEFMAHIVLPDGRTAGDAILPGIEQAYSTGKLPRMSFLALPEPEAIQGTVED